jgi:phosphatidylinositol dimannoside acyltransferase
MMAYRFFLWGSRLAPFLPERLTFFICDLAGLLFYWLAPAKRRIVLCNLGHVLADKPLKERKRVARRVFQNHLRNYYDLLRVHKIPSEKLDRMVTVNRLPEVLEKAASLGKKGIIIYAAHIGSFSLSGQVCTYNKVQMYLLVEPIKPPQLFDLIRSLREVDSGCHTISVEGSEIRQIFRALKQPRNLVCSAIDRDVIGNGVDQEFFGAKAKLPLGTADLALRTGSPVVPVHVYRKDAHYWIDFDPETMFVPENTGNRAADVERTAGRMLREIEKLIRRTPDQWVVLQPIWPDCL